MSDEEQQDSEGQADQADQSDQAEQPNRNFPISESARFTIGGKPLALDDFIDITTGDIANRPIVEPRPQPEPMPKDVVWAARRPVED